MVLLLFLVLFPAPQVVVTRAEPAELAKASPRADVPRRSVRRPCGFLTTPATAATFDSIIRQRPSEALPRRILAVPLRVVVRVRQRFAAVWKLRSQRLTMQQVQRPHNSSSSSARRKNYTPLRRQAAATVGRQVPPRRRARGQGRTTRQWRRHLAVRLVLPGFLRRRNILLLLREMFRRLILRVLVKELQGN